MEREKKGGIKGCSINRDNHSLKRIAKKSPIKSLEEIHKARTEDGVDASSATTQTY